MYRAEPVTRPWCLKHVFPKVCVRFNDDGTKGEMTAWYCSVCEWEELVSNLNAGPITKHMLRWDVRPWWEKVLDKITGRMFGYPTWVPESEQ